MPIKHTEVQQAKSGGNAWEILPEDFYQVVVKDLDEKDIQKYGAAPGVLETKYLFKLTVLDEGDFQGVTVTDFVTPKWFIPEEAGKKNKKGEVISPSKLMSIFKAFYAYYHPDIDVNDLSAPSMSMVNDLIGKQVRISVKVKGDKPEEGEEDRRKNKITDYMVIKKELEVSDDIRVAKVAPAKESKSVVEEDDEEEEESNSGFIAGLEKSKKEESEAAE